jgi:hypothetical protein
MLWANSFPVPMACDLRGHLMPGLGQRPRRAHRNHQGIHFQADDWQIERNLQIVKQIPMADKKRLISGRWEFTDAVERLSVAFD